MELIWILYVFLYGMLDGIDMDFTWFFLYGVLMELIWILYVFFVWNFDGIEMEL